MLSVITAHSVPRPGLIAAVRFLFKGGFEEETISPADGLFVLHIDIPYSQTEKETVAAKRIKRVKDRLNEQGTDALLLPRDFKFSESFVQYEIFSSRPFVRALGPRIVSSLAAASRKTPDTLAFGLWDPRSQADEKLVGAICRAARDVYWITPETDSIKEVVEKVMEYFGASVFVTQNLSVFKECHAVIALDECERLLKQQMRVQTAIINLGPVIDSCDVWDGVGLWLEPDIKKRVPAGIDEMDFFAAFYKDADSNLFTVNALKNSKRSASLAEITSKWGGY